MTVSVAAILGVGVLTLGLLSFWLVYRAGGSDERIDRERDAREAAQRTLDRVTGPMPSKVQRARAALRELHRRARVRDRG